MRVTHDTILANSRSMIRVVRDCLHTANTVACTIMMFALYLYEVDVQDSTHERPESAFDIIMVPITPTRNSTRRPPAAPRDLEGAGSAA